MTELRFSYEPFKKDFIKCGTTHSLALYNKGKQKEFDQYIRGILYKEKLYLRTFYPFEGIEDLNGVELRQRSRELLESFKGDLLGVVAYEYGFTPTEIIYNAENDLLTGIGIANI
jgi:hypothetical protein